MKNFMINKKITINKKSQAWGIDLMVAVGIFSVAIVVFFVYSINQTSEARETLEDLLYNGKIISNSILSEGYPENWEEFNVIKIGVLDEDGKIDEEKLERFYNFVQTDYPQTKNLFNTRYDYYFFLSENMTINLEEVEGVGKPEFDMENIEVDNIIKITRFTIYKDKPVSAYLYIWEE